MSEALVSVVLQDLAKFVSENAQKELRLLSGVEREVKTLENNLKAIQAVLRDAELKQMQSEAIKHWLDRLQEVSYDMEDELDEWSTKLVKPDYQNASSIKRKVLSLIPNFLFGQILNRHCVGTRIKEINEELDQIAKERDRYQLMSWELKRPRSRESVSFVDISKLHGRDKDKDYIKGLLLSGYSSVSEIKTISVVGMGGIGKTALAQLVYNDDGVRANFDQRIWVCVSNAFDQTKVARDIIVALEKNDICSMSLPDSVSLESYLGRIRRQIESKKFLLVLDDVWTEHDEDWEPIEATLRLGMPGSRILVTTRKESVARKMKSSWIFQLETLAEVECWLILREIAFHGRDRNECEILEEIGKEIAKKSKGLPLVAKTLGGLLQDKRSKEEWANVLHSPIWKLSFAQQHIFTPLLLSFSDLPFAIKQCLLFCASLLKDKKIYKYSLINYWSALGYLSSNDNSSPMESIGEGYFNCLVTRSFFQDFRKYESGIIYACKIHDIVHDFLHFMTKNEFVMEEVSKAEKWVLDIPFKARHLTLKFGIGAHFPTSIHGAKGLRSLVLFGVDYVLDKHALINLIHGSKRLRLLSLHFAFGDYIQKVPEQIGKLIHLRHLDLSFSKLMKRLPEAVGELHNLQYLNIFGCSNLEKLPDGIQNLINLRSFYCLGCSSLKYYPKWIGRLRSLRVAVGIIVRADYNHKKELSLRDLENLDQLYFLIMELVGNRIDEDEAERAKFQRKIHLDAMGIVAKDIQESDAIKALNPPSNSYVCFYRDPNILMGNFVDWTVRVNIEKQEERRRSWRKWLGLD